MTRRKQSPYGIGVSFQHDSKNIYKRRAMPRYKKRKWVSFNKKVNAVIYKHQENRCYLDNGTWTQTGSAYVVGPPVQPAGQGVMCFLHAGRNGNEATAPPWENAGMLAEVFASDTSIGNSGQKIQILSYVTDFTYKNTSEADLELDIYIGYFRKTSKLSTFTGEIAKAEAETPATSGTAIQMGLRGVTPFNLPAIMENSGWVITDKKKVFLREGVSGTYQIRSPRNVIVDSDTVSATGQYGNLYALPYYTKGVMFIYKCAGNITTTASLTVGCSRSCTYTFEGCDRRKNHYNNSS